ncbi:Brain-specific angiogenesis inhibitor 2 [Aix galericulata]|nr:Brain-specific angiogenesis inhibitor 2 [Aix galericulata]
MPLSLEGQWLEWGAWSRCSVTCANGTQQRTRKCSVSAHGWAECRGAHADARECSNPTCPSKAPRAGEGGGGTARHGTARHAASWHGASDHSRAVSLP